MPNGRPVPPASGTIASLQERRAAEALRLMRDALQLLDENDGPHDAGAHLDDAINRLKGWLQSETGRNA